MTTRTSSTPMQPLAASPSLTTWLANRRAILKSIGVGLVTWPLALGGAWMLLPWAFGSRLVPTGTDRLASALQLAAAPAIVLLLMIASCMRLFDKAGAEDPFAGRESQRFKINQRVLANTVEQGAVFVVLLLALSTRISASHFQLLPVAVTVWCAGRLLFWAGYHVAPHWRAPGFDWTILTTSLLAGWFVYTLF